MGTPFAMNSSMTKANDKLLTGIPELDVVLRGGLPLGRVHLLEGRPGTGKTTIGLQFLIEGKAKGQRGLYIALSETEAEIRAAAASHEWDFDGIDVLEILPEEVTRSHQQSILEPSELGLTDTVEQVIDRVKTLAPDRVVIDSLAEIRLLADDTKRYMRQVLGLRHSLRGSGATVLALNDLTGNDADELQALVHGVISLEMVEREYGAARRRLRVSKMRGADYQSGWHDFVIQKDALLVFPSLIAEEHRKEFSPSLSSTGLAAFDGMLGGGLQRGSTTMFVGPSGAGKSSLALQSTVATVMRGENAVYFSFDESELAMRERARALGLGLDQALESGHLHWERANPTRISPGEFVWKIRRQVEDNNARLVVIDSLNSYLATMPEERALMLQMHELLAYLTNQGVVTLLIMAQRGIVGSVENPIDLSFLSDTIVLLRFAEIDSEIRRYLVVLKRRSGSHDPQIREFALCDKGIEIKQKLAGLQGLLTGEPKPGLTRESDV